MTTVLVTLFILSLSLLTWGLIAPNSLSRKATQNTQRELTRKHFAVFFGLGCFIMLVMIKLNAPSTANEVPPTVTRKIVPEVITPAIRKDTVKENKVVPYAATTVNDPTMAKGTSRIIKLGVNGVETTTYLITYNNNAEVAKDLVKTEITKAPTDQVMLVGTK